MLAASLAAGPPAPPRPRPEVTLPPIPAISGLPIPSLPTDLLVPKFIGAPATAQPIAHPPCRRTRGCPPTAPTRCTTTRTPRTPTRSAARSASNLKVKSASYGVRECATIAFDSHGRIVGLCGGLEGFSMMVIDPVTLKPISELRTSARNLLTSANPFTDICGGTYFFLDGDDVAYPTTGDGTVQKIKVQADGKLVKQQRVVARAQRRQRRLPHRDDARLVRPDLVLHPAGHRRHARPRHRRRPGRRISRRARRSPTRSPPTRPAACTSSRPTRSTGSTPPARGAPEVTWREAYDRGTRLKTGNLSQGSGTTPTLLGDRWVAINDNADPKTNVARLRPSQGRDRSPALQAAGARRQRRHHRQQPGRRGQLAHHREQLRLRRPDTTILGKTTTPGLARVMVDDDGCHVAWTNN